MEEMSAVTPVLSSDTVQMGAAAKGDAKVRTQEVAVTLPTLIFPAASVDAGSMLGEVPQALTEGRVPEETRCPLFWTPKTTVPLADEMLTR